MKKPEEADKRLGVMMPESWQKFHNLVRYLFASLARHRQPIKKRRTRGKAANTVSS